MSTGNGTAVMKELECRECGERISRREHTLQAERCRPRYVRWADKNRFEDLCSLILRAPVEDALPEGIKALQAIVDKFKL